MNRYAWQAVLPVLAAFLICRPSFALSEQGVELDALLKGIERCEPTKLLQDLQYEIVFRNAPSELLEKPKDPVVLPKTSRSAIGKEKFDNRGEYFLVSIPILGIYHHLNVSLVELAAGSGNGINSFRVHFSDPKARVEAEIGADVARINKKFGKMMQTEPAEISESFGQSDLVCDLST